MASLRLPLFRQLLTFMPKMANGARVTAEAFNAMSAPDRLKLLQATPSAKLQLDAGRLGATASTPCGARPSPR